jgi:hypothetical protein
MIGRLPKPIPDSTFFASCWFFSWARKPKEKEPAIAVVRKSRREKVTLASGGFKSVE